MIENIESWNNYAAEYYKKASFDNNLIHPGLGLHGIRPEELYDGKGGLLDIGCGSGLNTFLFAKISENIVIGIDPAEFAIKEARTKYHLPNLYFYPVEFARIHDLRDNGEYLFKYITFFGSLDYIELSPGFFTILNSISISGSKCFITKFHPFWTALFDNDIQEEHIKSYYDKGRKDKILYGNEIFIRFHYSISYLLRIFHNNGWRLKKFEEPEPDIPYAAFSYQGYNTDAILLDRMSKIPMTMIIEFIRE